MSFCNCKLCREDYDRFRAKYILSYQEMLDRQSAHRTTGFRSVEDGRPSYKSRELTDDSKAALKAWFQEKLEDSDWVRENGKFLDRLKVRFKVRG
jgi:hypothetical protein